MTSLFQFYRQAGIPNLVAWLSIDQYFATIGCCTLVSSEDFAVDIGTVDSLSCCVEFAYSTFSPFVGHFSDTAFALRVYLGLAEQYQCGLHATSFRQWSVLHRLH